LSEQSGGYIANGRSCDHPGTGSPPRSPETLTAISDLIVSAPFLSGAGAGLVGLLLLFGFRYRRPDWGLVWGAAVIIALATAGLLGDGLTGPGPRGAPSIPLWQTVLGLVVGVFAAYGILKLRHGSIGAGAVAVSIAGVWATVPDTERVAVLIGVTAALAWAWWPATWAAPRLVGALAIGLITAWVATRAGVGRETGFIGAMGSLGVLGWSALAFPRSMPGLTLAGHAVLVAIWSRWAGLSASSSTAVVIGLSASLGVATVLQVISWVGQSDGTG
jgi:hypothetical protein